MSSIKRFVLKFSFLAIPFAIMSFILLDGGSGGSIGGGGYDLSGLVYGMLLFTIIILWLIWMLICWFNSKDVESKKLHSWLLIVGVIALIVAWFITPNMF